MEKVRPWCGQPSDRGRLKNGTEPAARRGQPSVDNRYAAPTDISAARAQAAADVDGRDRRTDRQTDLAVA